MADEVHRIRMEQKGVPEIRLSDYSGVILGGGPSNVSDTDDKKYPYQKIFEPQLDKLFDAIFESDFPFLGICYGIGALVKHQHGIVSKEKYAEAVGVVDIKLTEAGKQDCLTAELPVVFKAFGGHKEACQLAPKGAVLLAGSDTCPFQMFRFKNNIYATQFHTELDEQGMALRIEVYKNHGYFSPGGAGKLIADIKDSQVIYPGMILKKFVEKYKR